MTPETDLIFTVSLIALFLALSGYLCATLFKRATNDMAYVRTGYGGETIVQNTGFFVLPILHHVMPVNLKTIRLEIELANEHAVLTKDYMKVNLTIDFYVRVIAEKEAIAHAARTLGNLTLYPDLLKDYIASQLMHAVRKVSAEMTMDDIHQQQDDFVQKIHQALSDDMIKNSLQLNTVTLKHLDQTSKEYFREDNAFDAEGLTKLSQIIESEKKSRSKIELQYRLENETKELEMEELFIEMENKRKHLRFEQKREIKLFEAANALTISQDAIKNNHEKRQAKISAKQQLRLLKQQSETTLSIKSREKLKAQIETDQIKAVAVKAREQIKSAQKLERADNLINIKLLEEKRKGQLEIAKITEIAKAKKNAAREEADATRIKAESDADKLRIIEHGKLDAEQLMEECFKNRCRNEADGLKALIEPFISLTKSELPHEVYPELIEFVSNKRKSNQSKNYTDKLQIILENARHSLASEALSTINDAEQDSLDLYNRDDVKT